MTWEPISRAEFDRLLAAETAALDAEGRATLERYGVAPYHVHRVFELAPDAPDPVDVVARDGAQVLFYDDTEEAFGTATVDSHGVMREWGTWGERLGWALRHFPVPEAVRSRPSA